jgi:hypothetical protein
VNLGLWVTEWLNMHPSFNDQILGVVCNAIIHFCIIHLFNKHIEDLINHICLTDG